ncbi:hypothetical protein E2C01_031556 [Portunus trituberculatus]|uniref:Uncharacterized protein n=1 Tax=Portunus trituberculatus TaxID=210409 RepID=A0A5B7EX60_PORTR|nr:hypothetical protein [Portunus trituberculatus]
MRESLCLIESASQRQCSSERRGNSAQAETSQTLRSSPPMGNEGKTKRPFEKYGNYFLFPVSSFVTGRDT